MSKRKSNEVEWLSVCVWVGAREHWPATECSNTRQYCERSNYYYYIFTFSFLRLRRSHSLIARFCCLSIFFCFAFGFCFVPFRPLRLRIAFASIRIELARHHRIGKTLPASCAHFFQTGSDTQRSHVPLPTTTCWIQWFFLSFSNQTKCFFFFCFRYVLLQAWIEKLATKEHAQQYRVCVCVENETKYRAEPRHTLRTARRTSCMRDVRLQPARTVLSTSVVSILSSATQWRLAAIEIQSSVWSLRMNITCTPSSVLRRKKKYLMFKYVFVYGTSEFWSVFVFLPNDFLKSVNVFFFFRAPISQTGIYLNSETKRRSKKKKNRTEKRSKK